MILSEREVLEDTLKILNRVFKEWVHAERQTSGLFKNKGGSWVRVGKVGMSDITGWITRGVYATKPLAIEVKRSDFKPKKFYESGKDRFVNQCKYLRKINQEGGVGFWINRPNMLYHILMPVLMHGAKININSSYQVIVTRTSPIRKVKVTLNE